MKLPLSVAIFAVAGFGHVSHAQTLIPNGDFEAADDSATWVSDGAAGTVVTFPDTGGSGGGGFASILEPGGGWGVLVSPPELGAAGGGIPLSSLGLVAGNAYDFQMDMINLSGTGIGGLKVEAWAGNSQVGNSGDMPASGQSDVWATYTWNWTLPGNTENIIVVPLWGPGSEVGFDNVSVIPEPSTYALMFGIGALAVVMYRRRK